MNSKLLVLLWLCLFPVASAICSFLYAQQRKLEGYEPLPEEARLVSAVIEFIFCLVVAVWLAH